MRPDGGGPVIDASNDKRIARSLKGPGGGDDCAKLECVGGVL